MTTLATRIHFAGLNTARLAKALEGEDVLISFADVIERPGVWRDEILPRLEAGAYRSAILDSGAFTVYTTGREISLEAYRAFALEVADLFDLVVTLDDIAGDVATSQANTAALEAAGLEVVPVFHQGEPWSELERLVETYGTIGVGFQRPIKGGADWLDEVFARVPSSVRVHGFGMTRFARAEPSRWPFATADSATWIAEYRALRKPNGYGAEVKGDHGLGGRLSWVADLDDAALLELVLASYRDDAGGQVEGLEEGSYGAQLEADQELGGKGQARTVLRRFSSSKLALELQKADAATALRRCPDCGQDRGDEPVEECCRLSLEMALEDLAEMAEMAEMVDNGRKGPDETETDRGETPDETDLPLPLGRPGMGLCARPARSIPSHRHDGARSRLCTVGARAHENRRHCPSPPVRPAQALEPSEGRRAQGSRRERRPEGRPRRSPSRASGDREGARPLLEAI